MNLARPLLGGSDLCRSPCRRTLRHCPRCRSRKVCSGGLEASLDLSRLSRSWLRGSGFAGAEVGSQADEVEASTGVSGQDAW